MDRRVVCAALRRTDGLRVCGARHFDDVMRDQVKLNGGTVDWIGATQGFIDQRGVFMTREEALEVAKAAGQIRRRCGGDEKRLYSENLY